MQLSCVGRIAYAAAWHLRNTWKLRGRGPEEDRFNLSSRNPMLEPDCRWTSRWNVKDALHGGPEKNRFTWPPFRNPIGSIEWWGTQQPLVVECVRWWRPHWSLWSAGARLVSSSAHVDLMLGKLRYQLFRRSLVVL